MPVYAPVPAFAARKRHPRALAIIVAVHAAALAAVLTARMDLPLPFDPTITKVKLVPEQKAPPENPPPRPRQEPLQPRIDQMPRVVPMPQPEGPVMDRLPQPMPLPDPGPVIGPALDPPKPAVVRTGPRFRTPESLLKPPYPQQKLRLDEEGVLRLKLSIDARGRVTSVEPIGSADPVFLAAARRHLIAHWRYQPATEDGRAVASSTVITLTFRLEN